MQRLGGVVIHMHPNFNDVKFLLGEFKTIEMLKQYPVKPIFDDEVCDFLDKLSNLIRKDKEAKKYPDIITFGFFCRKSNIYQLKKNYMDERKIGRGIAFQIAPSNVPIIFAYTLVAGLLAGNVCVVRASSKNFEQVKILCRIMEEALFSMNSSLNNYINVIQYLKNSEMTTYYSSEADIRVIWGGDNTIEEIRKSKLPVRSVEMVFADRNSLAVINAKKVCEKLDWEGITKAFYNDTYLYDQNACSSPRLLYWIGTSNEVKNAKEIFWNHIYTYVSHHYTMESVVSVDKLLNDCRIAINMTDVNIDKTWNCIHRIELKKLDASCMDYTCPGGSFFEYQSEGIDDLRLLDNKKLQTISYLLCDKNKLYNWVKDSGLKGIDRIVPMGQSADFQIVWDGYDLIDMMSRIVYYK